MFWADSGTYPYPNIGTIGRANIDGSNNHTIVTGLLNPSNVALAVAGGKIYWSEQTSPRVIRKANLDGSGMQTIISSINSNVYGIAIDEIHQKMYWTTDGQIRRANLDGTGSQTLVSTQYNTHGITLDLQAGKMYWTEFSNNYIRRANLDGTQVENVVNAGSYVPFQLALDNTAHQLYWTGNYSISRSNLDGSGIQTLITGVGSGGIALDTIAGQMYWTDSLMPSPSIRRANLDGSGMQILVSGLQVPNSIAVAYIPEPCTFLLVACCALALLRRRQ